jgi:hypothetical protein
MSDPYNCKINLLSALDWQRSGADIAKKFIENEQNWLNVNHCEFWENWEVDVFSLATANDFGLAVWSIILDESIYGIEYLGPGSFGFNESDENFFNGSFSIPEDSTFEFTTEQKRIILQLKAFKVLAIGGSIIQTNTSMANIFGNGVILAFDNFDMSYVYLLESNISDFIIEINKRDLLPRPIGIEVASIRILSPKTFGFAESNENFNDGNFFSGDL